MTILDRIRTVISSGALPRPVRAFAAGAAITWGSAAAAALAEEAGAEVAAAEELLEQLGAEILEREEHLRKLADGTAARRTAAELIAAGEMDTAWMVRAVGLHWHPVDVDALVEYVDVADSISDVPTLAAAIRHWFSANGPGGGLPDIGATTPGPVDEPTGVEPTDG